MPGSNASILLRVYVGKQRFHCKATLPNQTPYLNPLLHREEEREDSSCFASMWGSNDSMKYILANILANFVCPRFYLPKKHITKICKLRLLPFHEALLPDMNAKQELRNLRAS